MLLGQCAIIQGQTSSSRMFRNCSRTYSFGTCFRLQPLVAQLVELGQGLMGEVPEMQVGDLEVSRGPPTDGLEFLLWFLLLVPSCQVLVPRTFWSWCGQFCGSWGSFWGWHMPSPKAASFQTYTGKCDCVQPGEGWPSWRVGSHSSGFKEETPGARGCCEILAGVQTGKRQRSPDATWPSGQTPATPTDVLSPPSSRRTVGRDRPSGPARIPGKAGVNGPRGRAG